MYEKINFVNGNVISLDPKHSEKIDIISTANGKIHSLNQPIKGARNIDLNGAKTWSWYIPTITSNLFKLLLKKIVSAE